MSVGSLGWNALALFLLPTDQIDYQGVEDILSIPSGSANGNTVCTFITILADDAVENDESFALHVKSEKNVFIDDAYISVNIIDDDGKFLDIT